MRNYKYNIKENIVAKEVLSLLKEGVITEDEAEFLFIYSRKFD